MKNKIELNKPITAIVTFILALILIFVFVMPKKQESDALQSDLEQKKSEYENKSIYFQGIAKALQDIEDRKDSLEKVKTALPSSISFAPLVYFLQKKGSESGLVIKSVSFSNVIPVGPANAPPSSGVVSPAKVKDVVFTMSVVGSYQGFKNFLSLLESSARLFETDVISFSSAKSSEGIGGELTDAQRIYDFRLEVKTHSY